MEQQRMFATRHSYKCFPHSPLSGTSLRSLHVTHLLLNLSKIRMKFKGWNRALNVTFSCNTLLSGSQACLTAV